MRPVAEIMFCDFLLCGIDQTINYAAVTTYAAGGNTHVPLVIRTTTGYHGGPVHSKHLEAWIAHVPGFKLVFPVTPHDAKGLLKAAIREDNPVMIFESRHLYETTGPVPEEDYTVEIGRAAVRREGQHLTLVTYGLCVSLALDAAATLSERGIDTEVIDLRTLSPLDMDTILASVNKTCRLLIVHDGWQNCGLGAEIATRVYGETFGNLKQPIQRLAHADVPHPYSHVLADTVRPTRAKIIEATVAMMGG
jgi:pyruvate dehydrogenase E1 component beta subunit